MGAHRKLCAPQILVCSARRSKEAAAKQTFTLTGANRQNLRVRSTTSAQRLDFWGVDVLAYTPQGRCTVFVTRGVFLFEPCAYCWQSRKCFARALCANAITALITKAQAIVTAKWYAATRADIQRQKFQYAMRLSDGSRQTTTVAWQKLSWESMMSFVLICLEVACLCNLATEVVTILQWR